MADDGVDADLVKRRGWRQGSILTPEAVVLLQGEQALPADLTPDSLIMVITHDCDVTHGDWASEPYVDLLILRVLPATARTGNAFWGKSHRYYQLEDRGRLLGISIHERFRASRRLLATVAPDEARALTPETVRRVCRWIGQRFVRASFPDAFNTRVDRAIDGLRNKFKKRGELLSGIYVLLDTDDELPDSQSYRIALRCAMTVALHSDSAKRLAAQILVNEIETALGQCPGIEIVHCLLVSEAEITLDDIHQLKRWDFDDISLRSKADDALPPPAP